VNVVDGLKLYEDLFDSTEVSQLVSVANDLRVAGRRGQFQGKCIVSYVLMLEEENIEVSFCEC
jgi:hypothetical protein